jgi:hypothetical protein
MEMDRTCPKKTFPISNENSNALDPRRQKEEREAKNIMEKNSVERDESHAADLRIINKAGPG